MKKISFFSEEIAFKLKQKTKLRHWITYVIELNNKTLQSINYIFTSDNYLREVNLQYLKHNTYTDIITFDQSISSNQIEGDIFISIDRVEENAKNLGYPFQDELHRVMIHGILHYCGYHDKNNEDKLEMRSKEDYYLSLRTF